MVGDIFRLSWSPLEELRALNKDKGKYSNLKSYKLYGFFLDL